MCIEVFMPCVTDNMYYYRLHSKSKRPVCVLRFYASCYGDYNSPHNMRLYIVGKGASFIETSCVY